MIIRRQVSERTDAVSGQDVQTVSSLHAPMGMGFMDDADVAETALLLKPVRSSPRNNCCISMKGTFANEIPQPCKGTMSICCARDCEVGGNALSSLVTSRVIE